MIKINLLAERKSTKAKAPSSFKFELGGSQNVILASIVVAGLVIAVGWSWLRTAELSRVQNEKVQAEAELKRLDEIRKKAEAFKRQKELLERKINLITELKKKQAVPVHILDQVSRNLPDFMWLDSMTASANAISIAGKATTYNAVSNLYDNLRASGQFSDVVLGKTAEIGEGVSFSLTCRFAPPGTTDPAASDDISSTDTTAAAIASSQPSRSPCFTGRDQTGNGCWCAPQPMAAMPATVRGTAARHTL